MPKKVIDTGVLLSRQRSMRNHVRSGAEQMKQWIARGAAGVAFLTAIVAFNYLVRVDFAWRLKSAEGASVDKPGPNTTIHLEETHPVVNMQEETYILYSDLDGDGDLDIAYTTNSPIRFIENKTIGRQKN